MRFDACALVRCSSKGSPASSESVLRLGALRASHGLFAGGPLVGVFEHVALWGLFLGLLIGHGITCYRVRERVPTKSRTPLTVDRPRTSEFLGASIQPRR
jgi:hypothetical protein